MTAARAARHDELQKAILRLKNRKARVTITAVAREAGVSPALLHNTYPDVAEQIRALQGKASRAQRDELRLELARLREENGKLRAGKERADADARRLASLLEAMRHDLARARATSSGKVVPLRT